MEGEEVGSGEEGSAQDRVTAATRTAAVDAFDKERSMGNLRVVVMPGSMITLWCVQRAGKSRP